jgi:hypothetical protein
MALLGDLITATVMLLGAALFVRLVLWWEERPGR